MKAKIESTSTLSDSKRTHTHNMQIEEAVRTVFGIAGIEDRTDLDNWCLGEGRKKLYVWVQSLAPDHYNRLQTPDNYVRACYERMLPGYKIHRF